MALTKLSTDVIDLSTNAGALTIPSGTTSSTLDVEYLVVAGGGGSGRGNHSSGGGGAGGLLTNYGGTALSLATETTHDITVGLGGTANSNGAGGSGGNSIFSDITSAGGGGGYGAVNINGPGANGGSGGGGSGEATNAGGSATPSGQGNSGGSGIGDNSQNYFGGGGGGGAGSVGANAGSTGGNGGIGLAVNILNPTQATAQAVGQVSGSDVYYSGGGGGGAEGNAPGTGGTGGGGTGGRGVPGSTATDGTPNTGGGAGGEDYYLTPSVGRVGGSGVVILKYPTANTITISAGLTYSSIPGGSYSIVIFTAGTGGTVSFASVGGTGRPSSPTEGLMRENTTTGKMEFYDGSLWQEITDTASSYSPGLIPAANFNTVLYTGNSGTQAVTGVGFKPGFTWIKRRDDGTKWHNLFDIVRGVSERLFSNSSNAQSFFNQSLTSFDNDGFSVGSDADVNVGSIVAWNWKAGGAAVTNYVGTIASQVSANTVAGFSIVKWEGTDANATVGHGLGAIPQLIIFKALSAVNNWGVYAEPIGATKYMALNSTQEALASSTPFQNTAPSSTIMTLGSSGSYNRSGGMIAYCWTSIPGYSKIGFYVGTGVATGPKIYTGFDTCWVMIKRTDAVSNWNIYDNKRDPSNPSGPPLYPNLSNSEAGSQAINLLSDGFQPDWPSGGTGDVNVLSGTYIYMAFAQ